MPHYNLPHNHGQNMERVLNKMRHKAQLLPEIMITASILSVKQLI